MLAACEGDGVNYPPRNIASARNAISASDRPFGPGIVVSLVGATDLRWCHVHVEPRRSYDYSGLSGAQILIATEPGIDTGRTMAEVYAQMQRDFFSYGFPLLVDVERQQVVHFWSISPLLARSHPIGSRTWSAVFG